MDVVAAIDLNADPGPVVVAAAHLAERLGATLHLRTVSSLQWVAPPDAAATSEWGMLRQIETTTLSELLERHVPEAIRGSARVLSGDPDRLGAMLGVDADLVVCATHGRTGLPRLFLGSTSETIVRTAQRPTLVLRLSEDRPWRAQIARVLVAVDPAEPAKAALEKVQAWFPDATLDAVGVVRDLQIFGNQASATAVPEDHPHRQWALERMTHTLTRAGVGATPQLLLARDESIGAVLAGAAASYDLVAVTTHNRRGIARLWWGSTAERLVRLAPVPVLAVPIED